MYDVIVIGGGAAGMIAAGRAAERGKSVVLLEKSRQLGKKLLLTGNGRCNVTNIAGVDTLLTHYSDSGVFLNNAFRVFYNQELIALLRTHGVRVKISDKGRVFPVSERAADVVNAFQAYLRQGHVSIRVASPVSDLLVSQGKVNGARAADGKEYLAPRVIVATGGKSYPETGSSGDGFCWAEKAGHQIVPLRPGLVGLETQEPWVQDLQGVSLPDAEITFKQGREKKRMRGEMIFTHFGVSGPLFLDASAAIIDALPLAGNITIAVDMQPGASVKELMQSLDEAGQKTPHRQGKNVMADFLPQKIGLVCLQNAGIAAERKIRELNKREKSSLIDCIKALSLTIQRPRPFTEAMITQGGVATREINPKTMESKIVSGLYFCGEVIDIAGLSGGFNLQAAFSTGYVAGNAV